MHKNDQIYREYAALKWGCQKMVIEKSQIRQQILKVQKICHNMYFAEFLFLFRWATFKFVPRTINYRVSKDLYGSPMATKVYI